MKDRKAWLALGLSTAALIYLMVVNVADVLAYAVFTYYIARPIYAKLQKRLRAKAASAFISLFILLLPVTLVFLYAFGVASLEMTHFMSASNIPYLDTIETAIGRYAGLMASIRPEELVTVIQQDRTVQQVEGVMSMVLFNVLGVIFKVMLMFTISLYFLMDGARLRKWAVECLFPEDAKTTETFLRCVDADLNRIFYGSIFTAFLIAIMGGIIFSALNVIAPAGAAPPTPC